MNNIKQICKDPVKVEQKLQGKEFLLGKYFNLKSDCDRCNKDKKFPTSKRQKLLEIQHRLNEQQLNLQKTLQVKPQTSPFQIYSTNQQGKNHLTQMIDQKHKKKQKAIKNQVTLNYDYFLPLHRLWKEYIHDLISLEKNEQSACLKLLRSDFVGAQIQVVYSKVASYIGKTGIIIKETLKTFVIVKKPSQTKVISPNKQIDGKNKKLVINLLKNQIVFRVECGEKHYLVNGNTLVYRPSDRSKHKFKSRMGQKLNLDFLSDFLEDSP